VKHGFKTLKKVYYDVNLICILTFHGVKKDHILIWHFIYRQKKGKDKQILLNVPEFP
jgi:hypothetical protein